MWSVCQDDKLLQGIKTVYGLGVADNGVEQSIKVSFYGNDSLATEIRVLIRAQCGLESSVSYRNRNHCATLTL